MVLLPELDDKATRRNARAVLNRFRSYARMAGRPLVEIKSPTIDDMPKAQAYDNSAEKRIVGVINAQVEIEKIQHLFIQDMQMTSLFHQDMISSSKKLRKL